MIMIDKMTSGDITRFMKVLGIVMLNYGFAMYICYPHTGDYQPMVSPLSNNLVVSLQAQLEMALLGENIPLEFDPENFEGMSVGQKIETGGYVLMLYMYIIMSLILLLNLLIAMMGDTFVKVQEQAVREWRVGMLQMILRLEILAKPFTNVQTGTEMGGQYFILTRTYDTIEEGEGGDLVLTASAKFKNPEDAAVVIQRSYQGGLKQRNVRKRASSRGGDLPPAAPLPGPAGGGGAGGGGAGVAAAPAPTSARGGAKSARAAGSRRTPRQGGGQNPLGGTRP
jgi:hypothetical protein